MYISRTALIGGPIDINRIERCLIDTSWLPVNDDKWERYSLIQDEQV
ncbi:MAG: hypothetical protein F6K11_00220 [Leptolyngbya sp. SIO3F4]|nr:hypothetical protein [Leptolyngbya sp. SIO3F4]